MVVVVVVVDSAMVVKVLLFLVSLVKSYQDMSISAGRFVGVLDLRVIAKPAFRRRVLIVSPNT
jgi:hypothetical protein